MAIDCPGQIVVVFDVTHGAEREAAAHDLVVALRGARLGSRVESWWFADGDIKHVDRNDNQAMRLVVDEAGCSCGWRGSSADVDAHVEVCPLPDPDDLASTGNRPSL